MAYISMLVLCMVSLITVGCKIFDTDAYRERIHKQALAPESATLVGAGLPVEQVDNIPHECELYVVRQLTPDSVDVVCGEFDRPLLTDSAIVLKHTCGELSDPLWIPRTQIAAIHVSPDADEFEKVDVFPTVILVAIGAYLLLGGIAALSLSDGWD